MNTQSGRQEYITEEDKKTGYRIYFKNPDDQAKEYYTKMENEHKWSRDKPSAQIFKTKKMLDQGLVHAKSEAPGINWIWEETKNPDKDYQTWGINGTNRNKKPYENRKRR